MPHIVNERSHETFLRYLVGIGENILRVDLIKYLSLLLVIAVIGIVYYYHYYSLRPIFFVLFEKSNFLREHHLLSCLPFKNV